MASISHWHQILPTTSRIGMITDLLLKWIFLAAAASLGEASSNPIDRPFDLPSSCKLTHDRHEDEGCVCVRVRVCVLVTVVSVRGEKESYFTKRVSACERRWYMDGRNSWWSTWQRNSRQCTWASHPHIFQPISPFTSWHVSFGFDF